MQSTISTWSVSMSNRCIVRANVGYIWSVVRASKRSVELSVRVCSYEAQVDNRSAKCSVPWSVHEVRIPNIYESRVTCIMTVSVVVNIQPTNLANTSVSVVDENVPNLTRPTMVIVVNRNIFNLNHSTKIIILYVRIVVISRVECCCHVTIAYRVGVLIIGQVKVEFSVRVHRKSHSHLVKDKSVCIAINRSVAILMCRNGC
jgi:hypothetical protein